VKPIDLMRYLCRLVTPRGGVVLDLFVGSGTTGIAAALEGFGFIGIDMEEKHIEIAKRRIAWWTARCVAEETAARAALSTRGEQDERQRSIFEVLK
jgi:site-specific DNA-methyltransferase (adenine-specific)